MRLVFHEHLVYAGVVVVVVLMLLCPVISDVRSSFTHLS